VGVWVGFAKILHARLEITSPTLALGLFELVHKNVTANGGGNDDSYGFQLSGFGKESVVVDLDFLLEIEGKVDCCVELIVNFSCGGAVGALTNGLEELLNSPIVDGLEISAVSSAKNGIGDGRAERFRGCLADGWGVN